MTYHSKTDYFPPTRPTGWQNGSRIHMPNQLHQQQQRIRRRPK